MTVGDGAGDGVRGERRQDGLPRWHTSFVGRDREVAAVSALLAEGERFVTIVGTGGVGKTRLAGMVAEAARAALDQPVVFVALDVVAESADVLPAIASALGVGEIDDRQDIATRIADVLGHRRQLLILDNLEHLLDAAPDLRRLLDETDELVVLATSRAPLHIEPERVYLLDPLPLPEPGWQTADLWANAAVRLFAERARAAGGTLGAGDAEVMAEIVRRLDGLPLAIELAAARMWTDRSPAELLSQLAARLPVLTEGRRDGAARQRTLRDAIRWSYDLLGGAERMLFRRLSIFVGGFSVDFAAEIAHEQPDRALFPYGGGRPTVPHDAYVPGGDPFLLEPSGWTPARTCFLPAVPIDLTVGLAALVDLSLMQRSVGRDGEIRYAMLETVREFGLACLKDEGELAAVRIAHAGMMAAFAERSTVVVMTRMPTPWGVERVDDEWGNLRSALEWGTAQGGSIAELAMRILDPLWPYLMIRGLAGYGCRWLIDTLDGDGHSANPWLRTGALNSLGMLSWVVGADTRADQALEASLNLARQLGWDAATGRALFFRSLVAWRLHRLDEMASLLEEALAAFQRAEDLIGPGVCLLAQGALARILGRSKEAKEIFDEANEILGFVGYGWGVATSRYYAGEAMRDLEDRVAAANLLREGLDGYWALRDGWGTGAVVSALAVMAAGRGERERAARLFGGAETLLGQTGAFLPPTELASYREVAAAVRGHLGDAAYEALFAVGKGWPVETVIEEARAVADEIAHGTEPRPTRPVPEANGIIEDPMAVLTPRQRHVVRSLVRGASPKETAGELGISVKRVYELIKEIYPRWGVDSQTAIVAKAVRGGVE